ncbi:MAG: S24 family peptidase [Bacteroidetes bacterium]|nr:S24 family peptidase [Bacteroidota bacterium]
MKHEGSVLKNWLFEQKIKPPDLANKLGISKQAVYNQLSSETISDTFKWKLIEAGIDVFESEGKQSKSSESSSKLGVPYFDVDASAGPASVFNDKGELPSALINIPGFEDCNFWINCFGDSMYPRYSAGEIIACKEVEKKFVAFGEAFLIRLSDGNRYIKYIRRHKDPSYWILVSENEKYDPFDVAVDDITNVWIIKGKIKKNMI